MGVINITGSVTGTLHVDEDLDLDLYLLNRGYT